MSSTNSALTPPATTGNDGPGTNTAAISPVTVSLRVNLALGTNVELFAYPGDTAVNPVIVVAKMSAAHLSSVFTYQETGVSGDEIVGGLSSTAAAAAAVVGTDFAAAAGNSNGSNPNNLAPASGTAIFGVSPIFGGADANYTSVGHLALAWAAHQMFGHPAATAAIDNDLLVISNINGQLASALASGLTGLSAEQLSALAASIIGQDSARAETQGDNRRTARALRFAENDVIHIRIDFTGFTASNANANQTEAASNYGLAGSSQQYDLVITLSA